MSETRRAGSPRWSVSEVLGGLPVETQGLVRRVLAAAEAEQVTVDLVGGPVRDLLLGREIRDVDLLIAPAGSETGRAADASPALKLAERACSPTGRVIAHGRFGTVRLEEEAAHIDLASARIETYKRSGALPEVVPASVEDDLARRDFSVNAMTIRLGPGERNARTSVSDPHGGLADLAARRLRVLHDRSFHDDPTRAIRAARLAARLDFTLTRGSRSALRDALRDGAFGAVSGERFRRELQRCFSDARLGLNPAAALRLLAQWHVLSALEPGLSLPHEAIAPLRRFGRFVAEPLWRIGPAAPWQAGMAIWLSALPVGLGRRTLARLSIRGEVAKRIGQLPGLRDRVLPKLGTIRGRGGVDELLAPLHEDALEALWAWSDPSERRRIVRWAAEDRPRRSPLTGADATALGLSGPDVGHVLARVRAAHLDGEVANREEALALATELAKRGAAPRRRAPSKRGRVAGGKKPAKAPKARKARKARKPRKPKSAASKRGAKGRPKATETVSEVTRGAAKERARKAPERPPKS